MAEFTLNKERLSKFLANSRQEIANIQSGEPRWRTGPPLHFEVGKSVPIFAVLERLQETPTKKNFDAFIAQATQDLGKPTGDGFATWGQGVFTEVTTEGKPVVVSKTFADSIKDGFYDCFKVGHISMDQKQVDLLGKAAGRLAEAFQAEISRAASAVVSEKLGGLIEKVDGLVDRWAKEEAEQKDTDTSND